MAKTLVSLAVGLTAGADALMLSQAATPAASQRGGAAIMKIEDGIVGVGVVGAGRIGLVHLEALSQCESAKAVMCAGGARF